MAGLTVLYDEGCGFCSRLALRLARRPRLTATPIGSDTGSRLLRDLSPSEQYASVHVVDAIGRRWSGGAALPPLLRELPGGSVAALACDAFPTLTELAYRFVARHRRLVSTLIRSSTPRARGGRRRPAREESVRFAGTARQAGSQPGSKGTGRSSAQPA